MTIAIFGSANIDIAVNVDELPDSVQTIHARGQQINIGGAKDEDGLCNMMTIVAR